MKPTAWLCAALLVVAVGCGNGNDPTESSQRQLLADPPEPSQLLAADTDSPLSLPTERPGGTDDQLDPEKPGQVVELDQHDLDVLGLDIINTDGNDLDVLGLDLGCDRQSPGTIGCPN
jgi:hypothetical protein